MSRHDALGHNNDDEDNVHQLPFELRQQREDIKKRFEDWTLQKKLEEERARRRRM